MQAQMKVCTPIVTHLLQPIPKEQLSLFLTTEGWPRVGQGRGVEADCLSTETPQGGIRYPCLKAKGPQPGRGPS